MQGRRTGSLTLVSGLCLALGLPFATSAAEAFGEPPPRVRFQVEDQKGSPLPRVRVQFQTASGTPLAGSEAGPDGIVVVAGLPVGRHRAIVSDASGEIGVAAVEVRPASAGSSAEPPLAKIVVDRSFRFSEDVTISAEAGVARELSSVPQATNVIGPEEIAERAKTTLAEVAREEPGLHWQKTSPSIGAIFVRGLTGAKVNLFVDGVRFSTASARGGINTFFNLLDPALIESTEVTRGPSSAQYGSDAMGGSVQLFSREPRFTAKGSALSGHFSASFGSADRDASGSAGLEWSTPRFSLSASGTGRDVGDLRTGGGLDSHHAVTRFFGIPSTAVQGERLPDTSFDQWGGLLRAAWAATPESRLFGSYLHGRIDGSQRYDQLLGGDGNLVAEVRGLRIDLASLRYEHLNPGFADLLSLSGSFNRQREERVNQGGNGNPLSAIAHEPETTSVLGAQARALKAVEHHELSVGADFYSETVDSASYSQNAVTGAESVRRGRVPDGARYRSGGIYLQDSYDPSSRWHLIGALRFSFARYESKAANAPVVGGRPLWPDDQLSASAPTFRLGSSFEATPGLRLLAHVSRGYRAPHVTDLATLGLTGSGFEASSDSLAPLGASVGTTAGSNAISTGRPVSTLDPEKSLSFELGAHLERGRLETRLSAFWNDIDGNIEKYAAILPAGSVGRLIGSEPIVSQLPNGVVFVALSSSPVLARANQESSRIFGLEHEGRLRIGNRLLLQTSATYLKASLKGSGLPPNIEGGTPNPEAWVKLRWSSESRSLFVEPYLHLAARQSRLSSLDLEDRRTGASRSRTSIGSFFANGARVRGYLGPGPDGRFGSADDVLLATGETLAQILTRVLGSSLASSSLWTAVPGYQVLGIRAGFRFAKRHQLFLDLENLGDRNYRGPSWGLDAPGRSAFLRYQLTF